MITRGALRSPDSPSDARACRLLRALAARPRRARDPPQSGAKMRSRRKARAAGESAGRAERGKSVIGRLFS